MISKSTTFVLILSFVLLITVFMHCSVNYVITGGSTEDGNSSAVTGFIYSKEGSPIAGVEVFLLSIGYNHGNESTANNNYMDTTDSHGHYSFYINDTGVFNIEAIDKHTGTRLFIGGVELNSDTINIEGKNLQEPGVALVFFPDTIDVFEGYLYVTGTTLYEKITEENSYIEDGMVVVIFDSLTPGFIPGIYFGIDNSPNQPELLTNNNLFIPPEDTLDINAFNSWKVYTVKNSGLTNDGISALSRDKNGDLWIGTISGDVICFDGTSWQTHLTGNVLHESRINTLFFDSKGILWVGTSEEGLKKYDGKTWELYNGFTRKPVFDFILDITEDRDGSIWIATFDGLVSIKDSVSYIFTTWNSDLPDNIVNTIAIDSKGTKWVGTKFGISSFDNTTWTTYTTDNSNLPINDILDIAIDIDNTKWIASNIGLISLSVENFTLYENENIYSTISTLTIDDNNNKWMGLEGFSSLAAFNSNGWSVHHFYNFESKESPYLGLITNIVVDNEKGLLFAATNGGLIEFKLP